MHQSNSEAETMAKHKREEGEKAFKEWKLTQGIPESSELTDRKCQRKMKVGRDPEGRPCFSPYYGLTYMAMIPDTARQALAPAIEFLTQTLPSESEFRETFLYVPKDTYHITFKGLEERLSPKLDPLEIDYYKTAFPLKATPDNSAFPFDAGVSRFSSFTNLALWAEVLPAAPVRLQIGDKTITKTDFHLTIAYFVRPLSEADKPKLKECLKKASSSLPKTPVRFQVVAVQMFSFESMADYKPVAGTQFP